MTLSHILVLNFPLAALVLNQQTDHSMLPRLVWPFTVLIGCPGSCPGLHCAYLALIQKDFYLLIKPRNRCCINTIFIPSLLWSWHYFYFTGEQSEAQNSVLTLQHCPRGKGAAAQQTNPLDLVKSYKQIQLDTEELDKMLKQNEEQMFSESLQFVACITLNPLCSSLCWTAGFSQYVYETKQYLLIRFLLQFTLENMPWVWVLWACVTWLFTLGLLSAEK